MRFRLVLLCLCVVALIGVGLYFCPMIAGLVLGTVVSCVVAATMPPGPDGPGSWPEDYV